MVILNNTNNPINREERNKINENWKRIENAFSKLQQQIYLLSGEDVEEVIERIEQSVEDANSAASKANEEAIIAQEKSGYAEIQGDYAKEQGDYAKEQGNRANENATFAEQAAENANNEASNLSQLKTAAVTATENANTQAQHAKDQGDYAKEQGDYAKQEADRVAGMDVSVLTQRLDELKDNVELLKRDAVNLLDFGVVLNNSTLDQSDILQEAIDYCIANAKALYIPSGSVYIKKPVRIHSNLEIFGHNQSTYDSASSKIIYNKHGTDEPVIIIEQEDGNKVPAVKMRYLYIGRARNAEDDGYGNDNLWTHGKKGTAIYAHVDESSFEDLVVMGCKHGFLFKDSQINNIKDCDILFNETGIKFISYAGAFNIKDNNFCYNKTTVELDCRGFLINYEGNHAESALNHFIVRIGESEHGTNNSFHNLYIGRSNFTQTNETTESFLRVISNGNGYCYLHNVVIDNVRNAMVYGGHPIISQLNNQNSEAHVYVNNSVFWTDDVVTGGDHKVYVYWNSRYFKSNGSNWGRNEYYTNAIRGVNTAFGNALFNSPVDFKLYDYTNYPTGYEGRLFYNKTRKTFAFFNEDNGKQLHLPIAFHQTTKDTPPTDSDLPSGTIAQNILGSVGSIFGWVYNKTDNKWYEYGQIGYRTSDGSPVGSVVPKFVGEELLDTSNKIWYKSVGVTNDDWKALMQ